MTMPPPAIAAEALEAEQREEARRQAEAQSGGALEGVADAAEATVDLAASGVPDVAVRVAGACLDGAATVAQTSVEVIGGILAGLTDL